MKKTIKAFAIATIAMSSLFGCKKNEQDAKFKDVDRINLEGSQQELAVADSVNFSFAPYPSTITSYNLTLVAKVGGTVADKDREIKIEVDASKTTADPSEYALPSSFIIKAGTVVSNIPIILKRSVRIASRSVKLTLKTVSNTEFQLGQKSSFTFIWTDDVIRPSTWSNGFQFYLGNYSKVKHRLILSSTEYKDLNLIDASKNFDLYDVIMYIASATRAAKNDYNAANPGAPLKNEFGEIIDICADCK